MTDPCVHGPGMADCGHPDCVGERDYEAGRLMDFHPGWLEDQTRKCVALLDSLPASVRRARAYPTAPALPTHRNGEKQ